MSQMAVSLYNLLLFITSFFLAMTKIKKQNLCLRKANQNYSVRHTQKFPYQIPIDQTIFYSQQQQTLLFRP